MADKKVMIDRTKTDKKTKDKLTAEYKAVWERKSDPECFARELETKATIDQLAENCYDGANLPLLMHILNTKRVHNSQTEFKFIQTHILSVPGMRQDGFGNCYIKVKGNGDDILWSSHIDTVHWQAGTQRISVSDGIVTLAASSKSNCLGADDSAGIWLMLEMIRANKPGFYIFHRAEESGGLGANYIKKMTPDRLKGIQAAIALDRKGYTSVITYQGDMTASDEFAESLATALDIPTLKPDDTGLFTDTQIYADIIPECSNVSVGYFNQHTSKEYLDIRFLLLLRHRLIRLDTSKLVIHRVPGDTGPLADGFGFDYMTGHDKYNGFGPNWHSGYDAYRVPPLPSSLSLQKADKPVFDSAYENNEKSSEYDSMLELIDMNPEAVASLLLDYGIGYDELAQEIYNINGKVSSYKHRM